MALFGQSGWVDWQDFGHLLQQSNSWSHPFYKLCSSSHHNRWHRNYPIASLSPTKGWPELISSIPSMTVNIDCQLEIINIQLCCHLTPNASFYFICSSSVSQVGASVITQLQRPHLPAKNGNTRSRWNQIWSLWKWLQEQVHSL